VTQTKKGSAIESIVNILIGVITAFLTQVIVFPLFGIHTSTSSHIGITLIFTVVSFIRSYSVRRLFNYFN
jgi:uncharacterized membrane protein YeaQ/YmgE (transglycosylase-associated protein family)